MRDQQVRPLYHHSIHDSICSSVHFALIVKGHHIKLVVISIDIAQFHVPDHTGRWCDDGLCSLSAATSSSKRCTLTPELSPPPPPVKVPAPPATASPIAIPAGCCNPNNKDVAISADKCCHTFGLFITRGEQCMSSRWCDFGECETYIKTSVIKRTDNCKGVPASPPPPPTPPPSPITLKNADIPAGCCNPNVDDYKNYKSAGECCEFGTFHIVSGQQCTSSRW